MKSGRIEERYIAVIVRETLAALNYIHKSDIIHRDVKAANILVTNDGRVQLCDFGVAAQLAANHFKRNTFVGTPYWMAPEVISDGLSYNFKADIWSLGITIYEVATGNPPHADQEPMRAIFLIPRSSPPRLEGGIFSPYLREFVALCLNERPEDRPTASELTKTKLIKGTTKVPTSILRELIVRYENWKKSGGVRQSLAIGGDLDGDEDFDGQFGLDDDTTNGADAWDFDTVRRSMIPAKPTWEQSADATESILRTLRPSHQTQTSTSTAATAVSTMSGSTLVGSRQEHPLLKLFGEMPPSSDGRGFTSLSMNDLSSMHHGDLNTLPDAPISIEIPALNATSLTSASSISLPQLPTQRTQIEIPSPASMARTIELSKPQGEHRLNIPNRSAQRQDSSNVYLLERQRSASPTRHGLAEIPTVSQPRAPSPARRVPVRTMTTSSSPPEQSPISAPSSPSRHLPPHDTHVQQNGQVRSNMKPLLSTPLSVQRTRSPSATSVPAPLPNHGKPSSLTLDLPSSDLGLSSFEGGMLPPSPLRSSSPLHHFPSTALPQISQPLQLQPHHLPLPLPQVKHRNIAVMPALPLPAIHTQPPAHPVRPLTSLPPLLPLNLKVLQTNDAAVVVEELNTVLIEMIGYLEIVEEGLKRWA